MNWFHRDKKNFVDFAEMMTCDDKLDALYTTEFVKCIIDQFWCPAKRSILLWRLIPYTAMAFLQIWHMYEVLRWHDLKIAYDEACAAIYLLGIPSLILIFVNGFFELKQLMEKRIDYFSDPWNVIDWTGLILSFCFDVTVLFRAGIDKPEGEQDLGSLRLVASIASLMLCLKIYDWIRVFETMAFFIQLIKLTLRDVAGFLVLFVVALLAFGIPMLYIQLDLLEADEKAPNFLFALFSKALYPQYLIALGEFPLDDYDGKPYEWIFVLFFIATTFFTMITVLNMLITIMGETFDNMSPAREVNATKTKLEFISNMEKSLLPDTGFKEDE